MNAKLRKRVLLLSVGLLIMILISCIIIFVRYNDTSQDYTAYIYQDATLLEAIDLSKVQEDYTLTFTAPGGGKNQILVQSGSISVTYADCPDKVCVHQGVIRNSLLPITCLPHGLVIELKPNQTTIDTITY